MTIERPPVACRVTLILPDREMLPGRVDVVGDKALQLAMFATPRTPLRQVQRSRLFLEFINEHGVCRMTGSVEALRRGTGYGDEEDVYDEGAVGVQFTAIAEADRDRLVAFAYERELVAREWAMRSSAAR